MGAKIIDISCYLPEKVLTNQDLIEEIGDPGIEKIAKIAGVRKRHVVAQNETALDLAYQSCKTIIQNNDKDKIDFLILCTQSPDYYLPTSACILQDKLGLRKNIGALDFNLGCSGYIYGLALARGLIEANIAENVLLVTAETYSKHIHHKDKGNRIIFGDGATSSIIQRSSEEGIMEFSLGTDGSGYANLIVPNGGLRNKYDKDAREIVSDSGSVRTANHLYMNGAEIFNFTIEEIPKTFFDVIEKNNLRFDDIDYFIFHQANEYINSFLRKKLDIPPEKYYLNMEIVGNTVSSTIPIALKDCFNRNILSMGNKVLLLGFGVGYSWGATIINI